MAFVVRGKSGKVVGRYATKAEAERRVEQLRAGAARLALFKFASRSPSRVYGPLGHEEQLVHDYRTENPKSRAQGILKLVKNTSATKQRGCVLCGATGPTWSGQYPETKRAKEWAAEHVERHLGAHSWPGQPRRHTRQGSPTGESRVAQFQRRKLGERMAPWGSDFGYGAGPVGAVGSYYISGKAYPDRDMVLRALSIIVDDAHEADAGKHGWTKKDAAELRSIAGKLRHYLQHDYAQHSWPGQPRRHASAAKKGHRHHARRYRR